MPESGSGLARGWRGYSLVALADCSTCRHPALRAAPSALRAARVIREDSQQSTLVQKKIATKGKGILAMDESNGTCGKRLDAIGVENSEDNRRSYRELLVTTPGLGQYISGAILFEETLYQSCSTGKTMVEELAAQGIQSGIKARCCSFTPLLSLSDLHVIGLLRMRTLARRRCRRLLALLARFCCCRLT